MFYVITLQVLIQCNITGKPSSDVGLWMLEDSTENKYEDEAYHLNYYKNLPTLQNNAHTMITHTQTPDGMNQTILAIIYQPSDVMQTKRFACGADANPGYADSALGYLRMKFEQTYEENRWKYPCFPNC